MSVDNTISQTAPTTPDTDAVALDDHAARRLEMVIGIDQANTMLAAIDFPFPDATDLEQIIITICPSDIHNFSDKQP